MFEDPLQLEYFMVVKGKKGIIRQETTKDDTWHKYNRKWPKK